VGACGLALVALIALVAIWNWDWFIPMTDRIVSARLGRTVSMQHLHIRIAANPVLEADGVVIGNPRDFPAPGPFARIDRLAVMLNGPAYLHGRVIVIPSIEVDRPDIAAAALPDGRNNWTFPFDATPSGGKPGSGPRIGDLRITDGHVHAVVPKLKADFHLDIATADPAGGQPAQLVVKARGTYANQPITGEFTGGALLSLRDQQHPYPVDLKLANGPTKVALHGTVQDPLAFAGTALKVELSGQSFSDLTPLIGVPAPTTRPFHLAGDLTYAERHFRLEHLEGRVGTSDVDGTIAITQGAERPQVTLDLHSSRVNLVDLGGFVGAPVGHGATSTEEHPNPEPAKQTATRFLIPHTPIDLPRLHAADISLRYHGDHIEGRSIPLDDVTAELTDENGALRLHPLSFGIGRGRVVLNIAAEPTGPHTLHAKVDTEFRQVDVARLMSATHTFRGEGRIGGRAEIDGTGDSIGGILGSGNGEIKLFMVGGNLSALLVDLSGLQFGDALLSALGLPKRAEVRCLVSDFALRHGLLETRTFLLDTGDDNIHGKGTVNFRDELANFEIRTEAKHFTIGSLPAPIEITGHLSNPSIGPKAKEMGARGVAAVALGVLLTPLAALLPTIQLGLGEDNNCGQLIRSAQSTPNPAAASRTR
jgi:uncharacterized protein involved in outer membrane biogenesis